MHPRTYTDSNSTKLFSLQLSPCKTDLSFTPVSITFFKSRWVTWSLKCHLSYWKTWTHTGTRSLPFDWWIAGQLCCPENACFYVPLDNCRDSVLCTEQQLALTWAICCPRKATNCPFNVLQISHFVKFAQPNGHRIQNIVKFNLK